MTQPSGQTEKSHRLDTFDGANVALITMADGQPWFFPLPWLESELIWSTNQVQVRVPSPTYGPRVDNLVKGMHGTTGSSQLIIAATIGAYLLTHHYRLSSSKVEELLAFKPGTETCYWFQQLDALIAGARGMRYGPSGEVQPFALRGDAALLRDLPFYVSGGRLQLPRPWGGGGGAGTDCWSGYWPNGGGGGGGGG